jgi:hypothetical protein
MFIGLLCVVLAFSDAPDGPPEESLTITIEFFDWKTKKDLDLPVSGIPPKAKPSVSVEIDVVAGKPFSGKVRAASKEFSFSGVISAPVKGETKATLNASFGTPKAKRGVMTTIGLPLAKPMVLGGHSSRVTGPDGVYYTGSAFRVTVVKKGP